MQDPLRFTDILSPVPDDQQQTVAVVGGDAASVVIAYILRKRGHDVVWYRGQDCNPHPASGVLRTFAVEPLALPGYLLGILPNLMRTAVRGKLQGEVSKPFLAWVFRAISQSRPLVVEKLAQERAELLSFAYPAFAALSDAVGLRVGKAEVVTLFRSARDYAHGWAVHDVRKRHGVQSREIDFDEIAQRFPHLSPKYTHGMSVPDVDVVENADAVLESMKSFLDGAGCIARHWPQSVEPSHDDQVLIQDDGNVRTFDWVIRGDNGGPAEIWPKTFGAGALALAYRERTLRHVSENDPQSGDGCSATVLVDGQSGGSLETVADTILANGAACAGGLSFKDLRYLTAASYARIWRELAGEGWHSEGSRLSVAVGSILPDSKPSIGVAKGRVLEALGMAELSWTLAPLAAYVLAASIEKRDEDIPELRTVRPDRFS